MDAVITKCFSRWIFVATMLLSLGACFTPQRAAPSSPELRSIPTPLQPNNVESCDFGASDNDEVGVSLETDDVVGVDASSKRICKAEVMECIAQFPRMDQNVSTCACALKSSCEDKVADCVCKRGECQAALYTAHNSKSPDDFLATCQTVCGNYTSGAELRDCNQSCRDTYDSYKTRLDQCGKVSACAD